MGSDGSLRLDRLKDRVDQCEKLANQHGERFNIFSLLGVDRDETSTHSNFLAELLKPSGRHGEENRFLRIFLEQILNLPAALTGKVRVTRELSTEDKRRIDIVVETPELLLGIEVKIDAKDQENQLRDYHRELTSRANGRKEVALVYLTLHGKEASKYTLGDGDLAPESVHCLSFSRDIPRWLAICGEQTQHKPELSYALKQYQRLLANLTGTGASMESLLANELLSNPDELITALKAEKALPLAKSKIMLLFWEDLAKGLDKAFGKAPVVYNHKSLKALSNKYFSDRTRGLTGGIRLPLCWLDNCTVSLYVHINKVIHYGLRVETGGGKVVVRPDLRDRLRDILGQGNAKADKSPSWLVCYYHDPESKLPAPSLNFAAFDESVQTFTDGAARKDVVDDMIKHALKLEKAVMGTFEGSVSPVPMKPE